MEKNWLTIGLLIVFHCASLAYSQDRGNAGLKADFVCSWLVTIEAEDRTRTLRINGATQNNTSTYVLDADYGYSDSKLTPVKAEVVQRGDKYLLTLTTPASSVIVASQTSEETFSGTFSDKHGRSRAVTLTKLKNSELRAEQPLGPKIHIIWMGGDDCPGCREWRTKELPKLEQSPEFKKAKFTYVQKSIKSAVPARFFLPDEVAVYKDKLDKASAGHAGSPQVAIMVNDEVFDYFWIPRKAVDFEKMLVAIHSGAQYPFSRCLEYSTEWGKCAVYGKSGTSSRELSGFLELTYGVVFQPSDSEKSRWECPDKRMTKPSGNATRNWVCRRQDHSFLRLIVWGDGDASRNVIETDNFNSMAGGKDAQRGEPSCKETPWSGDDGKISGTLRDCMLPLPNGAFYASFFHFKHRDAYLTLLVRNASAVGSTPRVADDLRQWIGELRLNAQ